MAIDNQFRINELISSGSKAIVSKDVETGKHTFVTNADTIVLSKSEGGDHLILIFVVKEMENKLEELKNQNTMRNN